MKVSPISVLIMMAICAGLFLVGRWTSPPPPDNHQRKMDSLTRLQQRSDSVRIQAELREQYFKDIADKSFRDGIAWQKEETRKSKKKYEQDTTLNHRRRPDQRDSVLHARYGSRL